MDIVKTVRPKITSFKNWIINASLTKKLALSAILLAIAWLGGSMVLGQAKQESQYQTAHAEKGTLVTSVTASGTISAGNSIEITTPQTGVVNTVYVQNGDTVTQGQKIAEITLDQNSQQKQAAAWASYLSAISSVKQAENAKLSADAAMWSDQQKILDAQGNVDYKNNNSVNPSTKKDYTELEKQNIESSLIQAKKSFSASEQKYKDADAAIISANAQVNSSWLAYQQASSGIIAPITGVVSGLTLIPGLPIAYNSQGNTASVNNSNSTANSSTKLGTITLESNSLQATVNLSEVDIVKVSSGQKVTLTLDAFPGKTFTGRVTTIDTNGSVSSGVTTYPATITLDTAINNIYPNMAVNATIITDIKNNVLLVPSAAIQTVDGQSAVRVIRSGQITSVPVEIGSSNDTQTEIITGINEGDEVVTGSVLQNGALQQGQAATSPFSGGSFGGRGTSGRSGQFFINR